ncbi:hypothetical protein VTJ04DRAFT_5915 [Mycothermus thermophilus]|uniref:uncharacterized protein n=1 Tax=Humicola insolens TaxID=85995 RepID=UPI003743E64A
MAEDSCGVSDIDRHPSPVDTTASIPDLPSSYASATVISDKGMIHHIISNRHPFLPVYCPNPCLPHPTEAGNLPTTNSMT